MEVKGFIIGRVLQPLRDGTLLPNIGVPLFLIDKRDGSIVGRQLTGSIGRFHFDFCLPPGDYLLKLDLLPPYVNNIDDEVDNEIDLVISPTRASKAGIRFFAAGAADGLNPIEFG